MTRGQLKMKFTIKNAILVSCLLSTASSAFIDNAKSDSTVFRDLKDLNIDLESSVEEEEVLSRTRSNSETSSTESDDSDLYKNGLADLDDARMTLCVGGFNHFYEYLADLNAKEGPDGLLQFKDETQYNKFETLTEKKKKEFETRRKTKRSVISGLVNEIESQKKQLKSLKRQKMFKPSAIFPNQAAKLQNDKNNTKKIIQEKENRKKELEEQIQKAYFYSQTIDGFNYKCHQGDCVKFVPKQQVKEGSSPASSFKKGLFSSIFG